MYMYFPPTYIAQIVTTDSHCNHHDIVRFSLPMHASPLELVISCILQLSSVIKIFCNSVWLSIPVPSLACMQRGEDISFYAMLMIANITATPYNSSQNAGSLYIQPEHN